MITDVIAEGLRLADNIRNSLEKQRMKIVLRQCDTEIVRLNNIIASLIEDSNGKEKLINELQKKIESLELARRKP